MSSGERKKIAVLISGTGSNLQAIIDNCQRGDIHADIAVVISNRPDANGLRRAADAGIRCLCIDHKDFASRETFDQQLILAIDSYQADLVVLAGFMRILSDGFVKHYQGRLLNIHPSLLPNYPGLDTHQRAIDAGDRQAGVTVHFVTGELDGGPAIIQATVPIVEGDSAESLARRVLIEEHKIYPRAVGWFIDGRLTLKNGKAILDHDELPAQGVCETA